MFGIGDKVVYPMHGAGTIEKIEEKTVLGESRKYYILRVHHGNMQVMVPVNGSDQAGLRNIVDESVIPEVIEVLGAESTPMDENWNRRNRENMEHLKTGDIKEVAAVVRNLTRVDRVKKLSTGEKKLLINAKRILSSEISFVKLEDEEKITAMIEQAI
ncbi:MAG: CarD family transcriptional regulator [Firmicutes bacterium]|nr:CarD family transcriptional regulator [Bacillota bacterium]MBR6351110.1 CarD family transcriptional regulator [Bacillota bacterium]